MKQFFQGFSKIFKDVGTLKSLQMHYNLMKYEVIYKPVNHRLTLKEWPKVKSDIRRFPAHNIL